MNAVMNIDDEFREKIELTMDNNGVLLNKYDEKEYVLLTYSHATKHAYIRIEGTTDAELVGYEQLKSNYKFLHLTESD